MLLLALLVLTIGIVDAVRHVADGRTNPLPPAWAAAFVVATLGTWGLALEDDAWWIVPALLAVVTAWVVVPELSRPHVRSWALLGLALTGLAVAAFGDVTPGRGFLLRWYDGLEVPALDGVDFERFALAFAVLVFLHSSANVVVRLVLADAGPHVLDSEQTLKGGRILGPIERWFIFALALGGHLEAIAAIVAAKGIVRFPEISRSDSSGTKAEYVLVGSFVSWFLALLFVPLLK